MHNLVLKITDTSEQILVNKYSNMPRNVPFVWLGLGLGLDQRISRTKLCKQ